MNITCESVRERLGLLADGSLDPAEEKAFHSHLEDCAACAREEELMRRTMDALGSLGSVPVPDTFRQNLQDRLRTEAILVPVRRSFRRHLALAASLALCAGLAVGVGVGRGFIKGGGGPTRQALADQPQPVPSQRFFTDTRNVSDVPSNWEPIRRVERPFPSRQGVAAGTPVYYLGGVEAQGTPREYFVDPNRPAERRQDEELPAVIRVSF